MFPSRKDRAHRGKKILGISLLPASWKNSRCASRNSTRTTARLGLHSLESRDTPALFNTLSDVKVGSINDFGSVATGDFTGNGTDGKTDLVMTNYGLSGPGGNDGGNTIVILLPTGDGTFSHSTLTVGTDQYVAFVAVGDLNGDGKPDLVVASNSENASGNVTIFLGNGNGGFTKGNTYATNLNNVGWVGIAPMFSGSSIPSIVVSAYGASSSDGSNVTGMGLSLFQGNGDGTFNLSTTFDQDGLSFVPIACVLGHFSGSSNIDIACAIPGVPGDAGESVDGIVQIITNNGAGGLSDGNSFDSGGYYPTGIATADFNGDGLPDLVVANAGDPQSADFSGSSIGVLMNTGGDNFTQSTISAGVGAHGISGVFAVATGDFNLDGKQDIAAVEYGSPTGSSSAGLLEYAGDGHGDFSEDANAPYISSDIGGQFLAVGDFNPTPDGVPDVLICTADSSYQVFLNTSTPSTPTTTTLSSSANPSVYGSSFTLTATVAPTSGSGTPTGTVTFLNGMTSLGTGTLTTVGSSQEATLTVSGTALAAGSYNLTASYGGGSGFATSTSSPPLAQVVNQESTSVGLSASSTTPTLGQSVTFTAIVSTAVGTPTGQVDFYDGTTLIGGPVSLSNVSGQQEAAFTTSSLAAGPHSITATYLGLGNFAAATSPPLTVTVGSGAVTTSTFVSDSPNPSQYGQSVTMTATVTAASGTATGTVTFFDGTTQLGSPVSLGNVSGSQEAVLTISTLTVGTHVITADYNGATGFSTSNSPPVNQVVNQATTTTTVSSTLSPSTYGQSITFTAVVTSSTGVSTTGTVNFLDGTTVLGSGSLSTSNGQQIATYSISSLPVGSHTITASYTGSTNFATSTSSSITQQVNQAATTTTISTSLTPSTFGQSITFTATVSTTVSPLVGSPSGSVTFMDGTTVLGTEPLSLVGSQEQATYPTTSLAAGSHAITAVYSSSTNFATSTSAPLTQQVNQAVTTTTITSSASPSTFGQSIVLTATVSSTAGSPTGTVTFMDGTTQIGTGTLSLVGALEQATYTTSTLSAGSHSLTAVYGSSTNFANSTSAPITQQVNPASTTTTVSSSISPSTYGQSVTFTVIVSSSGGSPVGSVTLLDGTTTIAGPSSLTTVGSLQEVTFSISSLIVGSHSITAVYAGSTSFATSTSSPISQTVNQASSTTTITSSANPSGVGQSITLTAVVSGAFGSPTGTVTFLDGSTVLGSPVPLSPSGSLQTAQLTISTLATGSHTLTAVYSGETNFASSTSAPLNQVVSTGATTTSIGSSASPSSFGQAVVFTAIVASTGGSPTGSVDFYDGSNLIGGPIALSTVGGQQQAIFTISSLSIGTHAITAAYNGSANFIGSTSPSINQQVNQVTTVSSIGTSSSPSVFGQAITLTDLVSSSNGIPPTGTVTFFDGTTPLSGAISLTTVGTTQQASLTLSSLTVGNHPITAVYNGGSNFGSSTSPQLQQQVNQASTAASVETSGTPSTISGAVTFTAIVGSSTGSPTGSVIFFDGSTQLAGPIALATVGGQQQATFTTSSLAIGQHTITAEYTGSTNFLTSTSPGLTQTVSKANVGITLSHSATATTTGQTVNFTVTVASAGLDQTPGGSVTFVYGSATLGTVTLNNGTATFSTSAIPVGTTTVAANYSGDANFNSNTITQTISSVSTTPPTNGTPGPVLVSGQVNGTVEVYTLGSNGQYTLVSTLQPFGNIPTDVRTAVGDVNGDGTPDYIFAIGPSPTDSTGAAIAATATEFKVMVLSGAAGNPVLVQPFDPFLPNPGGSPFTAGGFVSVGDFLNNGRAQIVVSPDQQGGPRIAIFDMNGAATAGPQPATPVGVNTTEINPGSGLTRINNFLSVNPDFRGGARTAVGDLNGDGVPDLAIAAGYGGGPAVLVINGSKITTTNGFTNSDDLITDFFAFNSTLRDGAYLAIGDVFGNGQQDLILGPGAGGPDQVEVLNGIQLVNTGAVATIANPSAIFTPTGVSSNGAGTRVAVAGNGVGDQVNVIVGAGRNQAGYAKVYPGTGFTSGSTSEPTGGQLLTPFGSGALTDGVFVG